MKLNREEGKHHCSRGAFLWGVPGWWSLGLNLHLKNSQGSDWFPKTPHWSSWLLGAQCFLHRPSWGSYQSLSRSDWALSWLLLLKRPLLLNFPREEGGDQGLRGQWPLIVSNARRQKGKSGSCGKRVGNERTPKPSWTQIWGLRFGSHQGNWVTFFKNAQLAHRGQPELLNGSNNNSHSLCSI